GEEAVDFFWMVCIEVVEKAENVEFHFVLAEKLYPCHHPAESRSALLVYPVAVVQLFWAVETDSHEKVLFVKKFTPLVIQERAVSLEGVAHHNSGRSIFFLQLHSLAEKVQAHEGRLSPLPGKLYASSSPICFEILSGKLLQHFLAHPKAAVRIK